MATSGSLGAGAVRHIVMLKIAEKQNVAKAVQELAKLARGVSGVTWNSFSLNTDLGLVDTNFDIALVIDFPDKENYLAYAKHPDHVAVVQTNAPLVAARSAIQFSLAPKL
ncbi:hypothetical protein R1flu_006730 [Riccia fluitans]|uniref:Stress-response A/B barrel domain-containing protein n=1 Tax=Riccia fluitans TaxID=41844 RepID=A0ABD1YWU3_9MARC